MLEHRGVSVKGLSVMMNPSDIAVDMQIGTRVSMNAFRVDHMVSSILTVILRGRNTGTYLSWVPVPGEVYAVPEDIYEVFVVQRIPLPFTYTVRCTASLNLGLSRGPSQPLYIPLPTTRVMPTAVNTFEFTAPASGYPRIVSDLNAVSFLDVKLTGYEEDTPAALQKVMTDLAPLDITQETAGTLLNAADMDMVPYLTAGRRYQLHTTENGTLMAPQDIMLAVGVERPE